MIRIIKLKEQDVYYRPLWDEVVVNVFESRLTPRSKNGNRFLTKEFNDI